MERKNLWAPWRIRYIRGLAEDVHDKNKQDTSEQSSCFICDNQASPYDDDKNLVLWRSSQSLVMLNHFPYNNGHLLIAPSRHIADFEAATDSEMLEISKLIRDSQKALSIAIEPHGFNVGMNFGRCAGAGLPGHLHVHLVPRWDGDTNFMPVCSDTGVISQSMSELFELLKQVSREHNLPRL